MKPLRVNHQQRILRHKAIRIGAFLIAHIAEFATVVQQGYGDYLSANPKIAEDICKYKAAAEKVIKDSREPSIWIKSHLNRKDYFLRQNGIVIQK